MPVTVPVTYDIYQAQLVQGGDQRQLFLPSDDNYYSRSLGLSVWDVSWSWTVPSSPIFSSFLLLLSGPAS